MMLQRGLVAAFSTTLVIVVGAGAARAATEAGHDFLPEARAIWRVAACGSNTTLPSHMETALVQTHCDTMAGLYQKFSERWLTKAEPFLKALRPQGLPDKVVYPFGGGDLITAAVTFPEAMLLTSLSIETVGDPRRINTITAVELARTLNVTERNISNQFLVAHNRTEAMAAAEDDILPAQLIYALVALTALNQEPVSLRFFRISEAGALDYVTDADLVAVTHQSAEMQAALFASMELTFRSRGDAKAPLRTFRHLSANLDNAHLEAAPGVLRYLGAQGRVAAMTKAASYLLWGTRFTKIRDYLIANMAWMISDSTGIAPEHLQGKGFEQITYGTFEGPFLANAIARLGDQMITLWKSQPARAVPVAYGYPDRNKHWHLMITRPVARIENHGGAR